MPWADNFFWITALYKYYDYDGYFDDVDEVGDDDDDNDDDVMTMTIISVIYQRQAWQLRRLHTYLPLLVCVFCVNKLSSCNLLC